jgi:hypothetical protein
MIIIDYSERDSSLLLLLSLRLLQDVEGLLENIEKEVAVKAVGDNFCHSAA